MENIINKIKELDYYLEDSLYQFEVEGKGILSNVKIEFTNLKIYEITFYDISRFKQDVEEDLCDNLYFYQENIVLLKKVTLLNILKSIESIENRKIFLKMINLK